jgi:hypothetical protein
MLTDVVYSLVLPETWEDGRFKLSFLVGHKTLEAVHYETYLPQDLPDQQ